VRIAAIGCLGDSPGDLPFLLDQAKAKVKEVRTAALKALGVSGSNDAAKVLCAAMGGADLALAVEPIRTSRNPVVIGVLLETAQKQCNALITCKEKDNKKLGQQNERMSLLLECLRGRDDTQSEKLLLTMFAYAGKLTALKGEPAGKDVVERLVSIMAVGPPRAQSALVDAHETLPAESLGQAFVAACRSRAPAEVFALFSPYLTAHVNEKKKNRDPAYARREAIVALLLHGREKWSGVDREALAVTANLDPRWLDLAVNFGRLDLVQALAVPGHKGANALLTKVLEERLGKPGDDHELIGILDTMIRVGHPEATDATIEVIKRSAKAAYSYYWFGHLIPRLPKAEALPKLEALLPTLPERMMDQLLDIITELRGCPEPVLV
jgi:hypothetical protein